MCYYLFLHMCVYNVCVCTCLHACGGHETFGCQRSTFGSVLRRRTTLVCETGSLTDLELQSSLIRLDWLPASPKELLVSTSSALSLNCTPPGLAFLKCGSWYLNWVLTLVWQAFYPTVPSSSPLIVYFDMWPPPSIQCCGPQGHHCSPMVCS